MIKPGVTDRTCNTCQYLYYLKVPVISKKYLYYLLVPGAPLCESEEYAGDGTVGLLPSPGYGVLHSTLLLNTTPPPPLVNIAP